MITVEIDEIKIAHAVIVVLRRFDHLGAAFDQFGVNGINVVDEDTDAAVAGRRSVLLAASRCSATSSRHKQA
jgi:hypothetical protein